MTATRFRARAASGMPDRVRQGDAGAAILHAVPYGS